MDLLRILLFISLCGCNLVRPFDVERPQGDTGLPDGEVDLTNNTNADSGVDADPDGDNSDLGPDMTVVTNPPSQWPLPAVDCMRQLFVDSSVAAGGDGTQGNPLPSLGVAFDMALPGDCIELADGSYSEDYTFSNEGGDGDLPIVVTGGPGVFLDTQFEGSPRIILFRELTFNCAGRCFNLSRASYLEFDNITGESDFLTTDQSHNIIVRNSEFLGAAELIRFKRSRDILISQNVFRNLPGDGGTVSCLAGTRNLTVERNQFYNSIDDGAAGIVSFGQQCTDNDCLTEGDDEGYACYDANAFNNYFQDTNRAVQMDGCKDCGFFHNTLRNPDTTSAAVKFNQALTFNVEQETFRPTFSNNIIAKFNGPFEGPLIQNDDQTTRASIIQDFNLYYVIDGNYDYGVLPEGRDANRLEQNPLFADDPQRPWLLSPSSPAINFSDPTLESRLDIDIDSESRTSPFDAGASEF